MRSRNYSGPIVDFGENVMFKVVTDDKYDDRWLRGLFVGKLDQTDEAILLTPSGVAKARGIRRLEESERFKLSFLNSCKGLPWNPKATASPAATVRQGDPLTAGTKIRNMRITEGILKKYGRSDGCPRCGEFGPSHSTDCRLRLEKAMVDSGEAFVLDGQPEKMIDISVDGMAMPMTPDVAMPNTPRPAAGAAAAGATAAAEGSAAKRQRTEVDNDVVMDVSAIGEIAALLVEPSVFGKTNERGIHRSFLAKHKLKVVNEKCSIWYTSMRSKIVIRLMKAIRCAT